MKKSDSQVSWRIYTPDTQRYGWISKHFPSRPKASRAADRYQSVIAVEIGTIAGRVALRDVEISVDSETYTINDYRALRAEASAHRDNALWELVDAEIKRAEYVGNSDLTHSGSRKINAIIFSARRAAAEDDVDGVLGDSR